MDFVDGSTNNPTSWRWEFGDGAISTLQNPQHTYRTTGNFTVTLTSSNSAGSDTVIRGNFISTTVLLAAPVAAFTATTTNGTSPVTVQFTDSSTNSPTSWLWDFGDGTGSTARNASHTYTSPGTYTVSLTVSNDAGSSTTTNAGYVTVALARAGFGLSPFGQFNFGGQ